MEIENRSAVGSPFVAPAPRQVTEDKAIRRLLAVAAASPLLVLFAFTVPLTTLISTVTALGVGAGYQAWILSAMNVGAAAGLLVSGALGDQYGRRRILVVGCLLLATGSLLGGLAPSALGLVLARILQGLGSASILSCSLGLIGHRVPAGQPRIQATALWAAALGAGVSLGPILSAWLDALGGWRLPYLLTAFGAGGLALAAQYGLAESRSGRVRQRIDWLGALLLGLGLATLLAAFIESRFGWLRPLVMSLFTVGTLLLAGFLAWEFVNPVPLLDLGLFRRRDFVVATLTALAAGAGALSLVSLVPTLVARLSGVSSLAGAVLLLAWSATSVVTAFMARWLPSGWSQRARLLGSLIGVALGQAALWGVSEHGSPLQLLPGLVIVGIANGVLNAALGYQAVMSVPPDQTAMGSGANNTARYLGAAIGIALVVLLLSHTGEGAKAAADLVAGWHRAVLVTTGFSLISALVVWLIREPERAPR